MIRKILLVTFLLILCANVYAQDYIFFSDSPNSTFYDPSWGFANAPSFLERINENKFPVSTTNFLTGSNSLKLRWNSQATGDWAMAVASEGWMEHNALLKDSISFYVFTNTALPAVNLPLIYIEDLNNNKTPKQKLSNYSGDIPADVWTRIFVPLSIFKNNPGAANLAQIKTIFFGQAGSNGVEYTLYLDEVRMISSITTDTIKPSIPQEIVANGFEYHIDLKWTPNAETDLMGYYLYKFDNSNFVRIATTSRENPFFTDFVGAYNLTGVYKISAFDSSNNESSLSNEVTATTYQMTDEEFLDMVQRSTFRYFYDYAHPVSGLSRERLGSGETVTSGGSGFGVMSLLVGIEREFITRQQGVERMLKILNFLKNKADKFHGVFSHWLNGTTGAVISFSTYDNGGDLVETSYMAQGLLAVRQYFDQQNADEQQIRDLCTEIWQGIEWDWYRRTSTSSFLYWHWSPNYNWQMNMTVRGPNEAMIVYLLGIASPTHGVPASLFHNGWASASYYVNTKSFYGYRIWVGWDYGGPLFFSHYSFLGFDPRDKKDAYCNYFVNNRNITLIHKEYCTANPKNYIGYNANCWGLTASDDPTGYRVHEPNNDNGTITPSAALSSLPYTPQESIEVIKHLYRTYGSDVWGEYGFKDAFNPTVNWYAGSYLAIDQGPIIVMIENYRSQLLWNKFMADPEVQSALTAVGFVPDSTTDVIDVKDLNYTFKLDGNYPNPFNPNTIIRFQLSQDQKVSAKIYNVLGEKVRELFYGEMQKGKNEVLWNGENDYGFAVPSGVYIYKIESNGNILSSKMILQK